MKWLNFKDKNYVRAIINVALILGLGLLAAKSAFAGTGPAMPWDSGLDKVVKNLTGKTALAIGVLAMFASAAGLVFGGEMSEFTRRMMLLVLVISLLVSGASLMNILFGVSGALVAL